MRKSDAAALRPGRQPGDQVRAGVADVLRPGRRRGQAADGGHGCARTSRDSKDLGTEPSQLTSRDRKGAVSKGLGSLPYGRGSSCPRVLRERPDGPHGRLPNGRGSLRRRAVPRLPRHPEHVRLAVAVGDPRQHEQVVRQPVQVDHHLRVDGLGPRAASPPPARPGGRPCGPGAATPRPGSRPAGRSSAAVPAARSAGRWPAPAARPGPPSRAGSCPAPRPRRPARTGPPPTSNRSFWTARRKSGVGAPGAVGGEQARGRRSARPRRRRRPRGRRPWGRGGRRPGRCRRRRRTSCRCGERKTIGVPGSESGSESDPVLSFSRSSRIYPPPSAVGARNLEPGTFALFPRPGRPIQSVATDERRTAGPRRGSTHAHGLTYGRLTACWRTGAPCPAAPGATRARRRAVPHARPGPAVGDRADGAEVRPQERRPHADHAADPRRLPAADLRGPAERPGGAAGHAAACPAACRTCTRRSATTS